MGYYQDKCDEIADIFGVPSVVIDGDALIVGTHRYPIVDDVIVLLPPDQYPASLRRRLAGPAPENVETREGFSEDIQFSFGEEWKTFNQILPEHEDEFRSYFDLVSDDDIVGKRVCDLGCGIGRWSYFLHKRCRSIVLIDFSDAIFVARRNLNDADNALFFMGDLRTLPFRDDFADLLFSLGVLHHLPVDCLGEVRKLARYAGTLLIYLYYALDNRPFYFRTLLGMTAGVRRMVAPIRNHGFRIAFSWLVGVFVYWPFIALGVILKPFGLSPRVPLYEGYKGSGLKRIRQDVYDRFFTSIEQRVNRDQIMGLKNTFANIEISDQIPYWHFLCRR